MQRTMLSLIILVLGTPLFAAELQDVTPGHIQKMMAKAAPVPSAAFVMPCTPEANMPNFCTTRDFDVALAALPAPTRKALDKGVKDLLFEVSNQVLIIGKNNKDEDLKVEAKAMLAAAAKVKDGIETLKSLWTKESFIMVTKEADNYYYGIYLPVEGKIGGKTPFFKSETCDKMAEYNQFCGGPELMVFFDKNGKLLRTHLDTGVVAE